MSKNVGYVAARPTPKLVLAAARTSKQNVSRKNAKIFSRISQTFSRIFTFFRENKLSENKAKFRNNYFRENVKCECYNCSN